MNSQILKNVNLYKNFALKSKKISKKRYFLVFFLLFLIFLLFFPVQNIYATQSSSDIESELTSVISSQLRDIDLSQLDEILSNLDNSGQSLFGSKTVLGKLNELLTSEQSFEFGSIFSFILSIVFEEIFNILPILATICAIAVTSNLVANLRVKNSEKSVGEIIHFVCFGIIIVLVSGTLLSFLDMTKQTLIILQSQMQIIFPILLTLITAVGGAVSVGIYQPAMAILTSSVVNIFVWIVLPIFICNFIFNIVGNLSDSIKLDKFTSFFSTSFKWIVGIIFSLFTTFLTFQGISAGSYDGLSVKSAKYAIKSYIPLVGGYLSDGFNLILSSSILIKNALGVVGLILLLSTIIIPFFKIVILGLGLKLVSAIIEPITDKKISNFIFGISKSTNYLVAIILSVSFMYLITIALVMCTSNVIV